MTHGRWRRLDFEAGAEGGLFVSGGEHAEPVRVSTLRSAAARSIRSSCVCASACSTISTRAASVFRCCSTTRCCGWTRSRRAGGLRAARRDLAPASGLPAHLPGVDRGGNRTGDEAAPDHARPLTPKKEIPHAVSREGHPERRAAGAHARAQARRRRLARRAHLQPRLSGGRGRGRGAARRRRALPVRERPQPLPLSEPAPDGGRGGRARGRSAPRGPRGGRRHDLGRHREHPDGGQDGARARPRGARRHQARDGGALLRAPGLREGRALPRARAAAGAAAPRFPRGRVGRGEADRREHGARGRVGAELSVRRDRPDPGAGGPGGRARDRVPHRCVSGWLPAALPGSARRADPALRLPGSRRLHPLRRRPQVRLLHQGRLRDPASGQDTPEPPPALPVGPLARRHLRLLRDGGSAALRADRGGLGGAPLSRAGGLPEACARGARHHAQAARRDRRDPRPAGDRRSRDERARLRLGQRSTSSRSGTGWTRRAGTWIARRGPTHST